MHCSEIVGPVGWLIKFLALYSQLAQPRNDGKGPEGSVSACDKQRQWSGFHFHHATPVCQHVVVGLGRSFLGLHWRRLKI